MNSTSVTTKSKILSAVGWATMIPFVAAWPFLSTFPIFAFAATSADWTRLLVHLAFLLTGFWGVLVACLGLNFMIQNGVQFIFQHNFRPIVAFYVVLWTISYGTCWFLNYI
jgi:hypothetical protein